VRCGREVAEEFQTAQPRIDGRHWPQDDTSARKRSDPHSPKISEAMAIEGDARTANPSNENVPEFIDFLFRNMVKRFVDSFQPCSSSGATQTTLFDAYGSTVVQVAFSDSHCTVRHSMLP
jgi:hypothetical protein